MLKVGTQLGFFRLPPNNKAITEYKVYDFLKRVGFQTWSGFGVVR
jgi:hypothetical protein